MVTFGEGSSERGFAPEEFPKLRSCGLLQTACDSAPQWPGTGEGVQLPRPHQPVPLLSMVPHRSAPEQLARAGGSRCRDPSRPSHTQPGLLVAPTHLPAVLVPAEGQLACPVPGGLSPGVRLSSFLASGPCLPGWPSRRYSVGELGACGERSPGDSVELLFAGEGLGGDRAGGARRSSRPQKPRAANYLSCSWRARKRIVSFLEFFLL